MSSYILASTSTMLSPVAGGLSGLELILRRCVCSDSLLRAARWRRCSLPLSQVLCVCGHIVARCRSFGVDARPRVGIYIPIFFPNRFVQYRCHPPPLLMLYPVPACSARHVHDACNRRSPSLRRPPVRNFFFFQSSRERSVSPTPPP